MLGFGQMEILCVVAPQPSGHDSAQQPGFAQMEILCVEEASGYSAHEFAHVFSQKRKFGHDFDQMLDLHGMKIHLLSQKQKLLMILIKSLT